MFCVIGCFAICFDLVGFGLLLVRFVVAIAAICWFVVSVCRWVCCVWLSTCFLLVCWCVTSGYLQV